MHNTTSYECTTQPHMNKNTNRRSFLKSSAAASVSGGVFAGLIMAPGRVGADDYYYASATEAPLYDVEYKLILLSAPSYTLQEKTCPNPDTKLTYTPGGVDPTKKVQDTQYQDIPETKLLVTAVTSIEATAYEYEGWNSNTSPYDHSVTWELEFSAKFKVPGIPTPKILAQTAVSTVGVTGNHLGLSIKPKAYGFGLHLGYSDTSNLLYVLLSGSGGITETITAPGAEVAVKEEFNWSTKWKNNNSAGSITQPVTWGLGIAIRLRSSAKGTTGIYPAGPWSKWRKL